MSGSGSERVTVIADLPTIERIEYAVLSVYGTNGVLTRPEVKVQLIGAITQALQQLQEERDTERVNLTDEEVARIGREYSKARVQRLRELIEDRWRKTSYDLDPRRLGFKEGLAAAEGMVDQTFGTMPPPVQEPTIPTRNTELWT